MAVRSFMRLTSELAQEAQVRVVEVACIVDALAQHGDALDAEAGREAGVAIRVVADVRKNVAVHHTGATDLEEALVATGATAGAATEPALNRDLSARLDEWEVVAAEAHGPV